MRCVIRWKAKVANQPTTTYGCDLRNAGEPSVDIIQGRSPRTAQGVVNLNRRLPALGHALSQGERRGAIIKGRVGSSGGSLIKVEVGNFISQF